MRRKVKALQDTVNELKRDNAELFWYNTRMENQVEDLKQQISELQAKLEASEKEVKKWKFAAHKIDDIRRKHAETDGADEG